MLDYNVYVDGTKLQKSEYSVWIGSTFVKLSEIFVSRLAAGEHSLALEFTDGWARGTFMVGGSSSGMIGTFIVPLGSALSRSAPTYQIVQDKVDEAAVEIVLDKAVGAMRVPKTGDTEKLCNGQRHQDADRIFILFLMPR